jgi:hypothetical protein
MKIPIVNVQVDERFLTHRLKSTSLAGIITGVLATLLFAYRFYVNHVWSWDLLAVAITFVVVKLVVLAWYALND